MNIANHELEKYYELIEKNLIHIFGKVQLEYIMNPPQITDLDKAERSSKKKTHNNK